MATDTESMHDNMTRLRMKMVQQKLAHERERLQRSDSQSSDNGYEDQIKLKNAMLKRQELLDRIRQEQLNEGRPKTYSPRRRYTPSPPPSRRSLPDVNNTRHYYMGYHGGNNRVSDGGAQVKHIIEHQFRTAPGQGYSQLPPIQAPVAPAPVVQQVPVIAQPVPVPVTPAEVVPYAAIQPAYSWPGMLAIRDGDSKKDTMFNKSDFMDMMMLQNAQMHHMVMQQLMVQQLTGNRPGSIPYAEAAAPVALMRPPPSVYHHHIGQPSYPMPPMDYKGMGGNGFMFGRDYNNTIFDDGPNHFRYH